MKKQLLFITGTKKIKEQLRLFKKLVNKFKLMLSRGEQNSYNYKVLIEKIKTSYAKLERLQIAPVLKFAGTTLALVLALTSNAQTFVARTGVDNPLANYSSSDARYVPSFADLNNDGDIDALIGIKGAVGYAENTGTASAAIFTGVTSPISLTSGIFNYATSLVDIDGDGDFDVFIGKKDGAFYFYENTGTVSAPVYTDMTGTASDPLSGFGATGDSKPVFVDIDNDNDFDLFLGDENGTIGFFENTGNASSPVLTLQSGSNNPFDGVDVGVHSSIDFIDGDTDGDMDAYIGRGDGTVLYYKNTGTASNPIFTQQTGANNPLNSVSLGITNWVNPRFVDMDNDGDMDVFVGEHNSIRYYENTTTAIVLVNSITITSGASSITTAGGTLQMNATVLPANADDTTYTWSVTNGTGSATISSGGLLSATANGTVTVVVTANDASGITGTTVITISNQSTGINEKHIQLDVNAFPNPTTGQVTFMVEETIKTIEIFNTTGKIIAVFNNVNTIDISHFDSGIYFVKISTQSNSSFQRIIKE